MNTLVWIALVLVVLWLLGFTVFKAAGFLLHLLLIVAVIMLVWWAVQKVMGRSGGPPAP